MGGLFIDGYGWLLAEARKRALSRRFVAWVVCLLMGMGGLVVGGLFIDGYGWSC